MIEYFDRRNNLPELTRLLREFRTDLHVSDSLSYPKPVAYRFKLGADLKSREASYNLMYVANVIDSHATDIERQIGTTTDIEYIGIGFSDAIPDGGEQRWYEYGNFLLGIYYNKSGFACGVWIEGLESENLSSEDWHTILHRMDLSVRSQPDAVHLLHQRWYNYHGYYISVGLNKVGGVINLVIVYKSQKPSVSAAA